MQLYKRILLSYFPDHIGEHDINPASMFISFIAAREFFSIIHKRMTENYKLNMFDTGINVFDIKIWLGNEEKRITPKTIDTYYWYLAAANFNGYKFYNIANTANSLVFAIALILEEHFNQDEDQLFIDCLYSFYLISFIFASRIKVFPQLSKEWDFNWFVDLFFSFFELVTVQLNHKTSAKQFRELKIRLLKELDIFFLMFNYYRRLNKYFESQSEESSFEKRLFGDSSSSLQKLFLASYSQTKFKTSLSQPEEAIFFDIAPADIQIKYFFANNDPHDLVSTIVNQMYDKKIVKKHLTNSTKDDTTVERLLDYLMDPQIFKKWYFDGIRDFIDITYQKKVDDEQEEELEEFHETLSEIKTSSSSASFNDLKIPQRIKKESMIMEQLLNFYITYTGWFTIDKADTFYLRFFKSGLIEQIEALKLNEKNSISDANFYSRLQFFYSRNTYFYSYTHKAIRKGKEKFYISLGQKIPQIPISPFLKKSYFQEAVIVLFSDINPQVGKLHLKTPSILKWFQAKFGKDISTMIKKPKDQFVSDFFAPFWLNVDISRLPKFITDDDLTRLKDSMYSIDWRIMRNFMSRFPLQKYQNRYSDTVILQILAEIKELLPGFMLSYHYFITQNKKEKKLSEFYLLSSTFLWEIIRIEPELIPELQTIIMSLIDEFGPAFDVLCGIDDNKDFLDLLRKNWQNFSKKKNFEFSMEDLLWLRWTRKHITYYNKRYLIPG